MQTDWKNNFTKIVLEKVELQDKIKVEMPLEILNKIKYLCKTIPNVEWSGVLFYTLKGSIKKPEKAKIILRDILPLDKGSSAYTEYELDDRYINYLMDNPEALEWKVAHIHSHNTMSTFFSGTDMSELEDNSKSHNFYLSLIVNNYMDFKAKVAIRATVKEQIKSSYKALDEKGKEYSIQETTLKINKDKLFIYDCDITSPVENITVNDDFTKKVEAIIQKEKDESTSTKMMYQNNFAISNIEEHKNFKNPNFNSFFPKNSSESLFNKVELTNEEDGFEPEPITDTEEFLMSIFHGYKLNDAGVPVCNNTMAGDLDDALVDLVVSYEHDEKIILSEKFLEIFKSRFETTYKVFFGDKDILVEGSNEVFYLIVLEECLDILEDLEPFHPYISPLIMYVKTLQKEYGTTI